MKKIKVGITGQPGFMGSHLFNYLKNQNDAIELIPFEDEYFESNRLLKDFCLKCDTIVHLAAMNRHENPQVIYDTNINLVKQLINILTENKHNPHIIFSSSTQEENDNPYGKSKSEGRKLITKWANNNNAKFSGLVIPNVFGPFGKPFYNSVVATFCHQLANDLMPKIEIDAKLNLIYINELVDVFYRVIIGKIENEEYFVPHTSQKKVSEILDSLINFRDKYLKDNIVPEFKDNFELSLFNTYRTFIDQNHFPVSLDLRSDNRGHLFEIIKENTGGQSFFSTTKPGITRGNHYHTRKLERFCVVQGEAIIRLRRIGTDELIEYKVNGINPSTIDIPIFYTHNIKNTGSENLLTLFWSNEIFDPDDPDTYFEEV